MPLIPLHLTAMAVCTVQGWCLHADDLEKSFQAALSKGALPYGLLVSRLDKHAACVGVVTRALVVINPGNPTGNCLSLEDMKVLHTLNRWACALAQWLCDMLRLFGLAASCEVLRATQYCSDGG